MQPCRNQDFFKNASSAHKKRMKEFRELARQMVEERNDQILTENWKNMEYRESLEERIRNAPILCEGDVAGMEYYSQFWNGRMVGDRVKLNF